MVPIIRCMLRCKIMTEDIALVAGFTPEWALVLEDPGITADPEPYYTGRYLDGGKVTLTATPPEGGFRLQEEASGYRLQATGRGLQTTGLRLQDAGSRCSPRPCESV